MTSAPFDPEAFRVFEHAGWQHIPRQYHDGFATLTAQAIGPLLDAVDVRSGPACSMSPRGRGMSPQPRHNVVHARWESTSRPEWSPKRAVQKHGDMNVPLPPGPPFFRFSEPQECARVLLEAGFVAPGVMQVPQVWRLRSPEALFEIMYGSTVRTAALLRAQAAEALDAIRTGSGRRQAVGHRTG